LIVTGEATPDEVAGMKRSRSGLYVGAGVAVAAAAIVFAVLHSGGAPVSTAPAHAPPSGVPAVSVTPPPVAPPVTAAAIETAKPAPSSSTTVVSINDLPNADDKKKATPTGPGVKVAPTASAEVPGKVPRSASTQWVPTVQNPGF
jgi:hypothetical protein